jgi:predicted DNA-binding WGR domain protein
MFVWVPRECFLFSRFDFSMPPLMRMPAYEAKAYSAGVSWKPGDDPGTWLGEPVIAERRVGVVASLVNDWAMVLTFDRHSRGTFGVKASELQRATPKKPTGTQLTYGEVLKVAESTITAVEKNGDTVALEIRVPPDGRSLAFQTETDAFEVLYAPLVDKRGVVGTFKPSELSNALTADLTERELEGAHRVSDIRAELAKKYVRSFRLEGPIPYSGPALDKMSETDAHDELAKPWPSATLRIVVTDPKWIAHLDASSYDWFPLLTYPLDPPCDPKPKPPPAPIVRPDARAVLWFAKDKSDKIWMIERFGKTLKTRYGRRRDKHRTEKNEVLADEAAAIKAYDKAIAKKTREGYAAPFTTAEAVAIVEKKLGVVLDDDGSGTLVVASAEGCELRAKDRVEHAMLPVGQVEIHVIEELAIAMIDVPAGTRIYLNYTRPATGVWTGAAISVRA